MVSHNSPVCTLISHDLCQENVPHIMAAFLEPSPWEASFWLVSHYVEACSHSIQVLHAELVQLCAICGAYEHELHVQALPEHLSRLWALIWFSPLLFLFLIIQTFCVFYTVGQIAPLPKVLHLHLTDGCPVGFFDT